MVHCYSKTVHHFAIMVHQKSHLLYQMAQNTLDCFEDGGNANSLYSVLKDINELNIGHQVSDQQCICNHNIRSKQDLIKLGCPR